MRSDRWNPHQVRSAWNVVYLVREGTCAATLGRTRVMLQPGTLLWWPPGTAITLTWPPVFAFAEVWFRLDGCRPPEDAPVVDDAWEALALLDACSDEIPRASPQRDRRLRHLLALLVLEFSRQRPRGPRLAPAQRTALAAFLRANLHRRVHQGELARVAVLSGDYFARVFHAAYGRPPRAWMVEERVHAARLLREGDDTVAAIADRLGYGSVAQFCRQFHAIMGQPPRAWRHGQG